jgi:ribosomal protein S18 acetylase RimI-like enzyme
MINNSINFQSLKISQIETITQMMQKFYAIDHYPIDIEVSKKLFHEFITNENLGKSWLIYCDETIVGYVILTFVFSFEYQGRMAFLDELYISENARGKGIGKITLEFIRNHAIQNKLKLIYLEIEPHNEVAKKLYISNDYVIHKRQFMKLKPKP